MNHEPATPGQTAPANQQSPSQPATPGTNPANDNSQPPAQQQAQQPPQSGGQVTIPTEEYAQLQRDGARLKSLQKRSNRGGQQKQATKPGESNYDENEDLVAERNKNQELEQRLFQRDVKDATRDLLARQEYANLPESTRKLILRNPHSLSDAESLDEVILDIEDFLREETAAMKGTNASQVTAQSQQQQVQNQMLRHSPVGQQQGYEIPPSGAGSPTPPPATQLENVDGLTGSARSQTVLRNLIKKGRGVQG